MAHIIIEGWTPKRDIQLRQTQSGKPVLTFAVREDHRKFIGNGQFEDDGHTWYEVTAWGNQAEAAAQIVQPNSRVLVTGTVREREFEHQGQQRKKLEVTAGSIGLVDVGQ